MMKSDFKNLLLRSTLEMTTANEPLLSMFSVDRLPDIERTRILERAAKACIKQLKTIAKYAQATGKLALAAAIIAQLSACANVYQKPGGTSAEFEQVSAACAVEAVQTVPVAPMLMEQRGERYVTRECDKKGRHCEEYSTFQPPGLAVVDGNAPVREQVKRGCLARHGWTPLTPF